MITQIGAFREYELVLCSGFDSVRGIIGREKILENRILVFRNCPQIHSFFAQQPFYATFIEANYRTYECVQMLPNRLSMIKSWNTICLESKDLLSASEIESVIKLFSEKNFK